MHRGCFAVLPDKKTLAVMNLYDGIDWYLLDSNHFMDDPFQHSLPHPILENVILPVAFIYDGNAVLSGMSYRYAQIIDANTWTLIRRLSYKHR